MYGKFPSWPFSTMTCNNSSQFDHNLCRFAVKEPKAPIQNVPLYTLDGKWNYINWMQYNAIYMYRCTLLTRRMTYTFNQGARPIPKTCWNRGWWGIELPSGCSTKNLMPFAQQRRRAKASLEHSRFPVATNVYPAFPRYPLNTSRPAV
jgi:hypothetical protein